MRSHLLAQGLGVLCLVALLAQTAPAAGPPTAGEADLARLIDRTIANEAKKRNVLLAPLADDHEFVRRVYLDLAGRIPRVSETRAFVEDSHRDKRQRLVEKLLEGGNYLRHFTNSWRDLLIPSSNNQQVQFLGNQLDGWIRGHVQKNTPYDRVVRELITTQIGAQNVGLARPLMRTDGNTAIAFFQANELKPDNLAASVSRIFLGVKIECAQCHDHPFAHWKRKQFWEFAAFFGGIRPTNPQAGIFGGATDDTKGREIALPNSDKKVTARFLDGKEPAWQEDSLTRVMLADWMTSKDNPYFSKATVNRMWEHFFGIGLVDPVDDMRDENPPSHPELLDALAKALTSKDFDLKYLIRAITMSKTYQRTATLTDPTQDDLRAFARMPLKGLTPEQIFESLSTAVGYRGNATAGQFRGFGDMSARGQILSTFANPVDRKTEWQTSILQALALMNGRFVSDATSLERSETLAAVLDSPFMNTKQKLDTLHLAALGRPMRPSEISRLVPYVTSGGPSKDSKKALSDVFWVLLNSSEFILNH